ncbi:hypothetical protein GGR39_001523 [Novosphingobium fluoreni]|uniref:Uncharacterized protein n=1 Tax=Novosphingobium fluoreni TaxID=1391222 RepID=A0A7W6FY20_9SPHN|nr:hypothetical protein [Novosphingobium fluoreni]MBB3939873.1 hypothetical protein [Novosphingobium fluoreni]
MGLAGFCELFPSVVLHIESRACGPAFAFPHSPVARWNAEPSLSRQASAGHNVRRLPDIPRRYPAFASGQSIVSGLKKRPDRARRSGLQVLFEGAGIGLQGELDF